MKSKRYSRTMPRCVHWLFGVSFVLLPGCGSRVPATAGATGNGGSNEHGSMERSSTGSRSGPGSATVLLFGAASAADALNEIRDSFQSQYNVTIQTNYAATASLAQQVMSGASADVLLSASEAWAEKLVDAGSVADRRDLLGNELVVIVPNESSVELQAISDLIRDEVRHVAMGDPESVPAGIYAKQALTKLELWDRLRAKVVSGADVRQALTFVETGAAEAGIVYATDAQISKRVRVVSHVDSELSDPIRYPLLLLRNGESNTAARQFFEFLAGTESVTIFRKHGFKVFE